MKALPDAAAEKLVPALPLLAWKTFQTNFMINEVQSFSLSRRFGFPSILSLFNIHWSNAKTLAASNGITKGGLLVFSSSTGFEANSFRASAKEKLDLL